ncbi:MAG: uracil-DNA glycosylase [Thaumarchaeota archaeon]|nr:uracil-DNA glycosylase [Nitrososphaerota archaeon]
MERIELMRRADSDIQKCELCRLSKSRTNAVPGSGNVVDVEIVFVGEGPGRNEDLAGKPFVGSGGRLLDQLMQSAGLKRESVYITNIVKCRPPKNRKPVRDEVEICTSNYLERQLDILKPKLICTLGATALEYFTGETKMGENHGKLFHARKSGIPVLPTYHPASIFRNPPYRKLLENDLRMLPNIIESLGKTSKTISA